MNDIAIHVEGLGKEYRIGVRQEQYRALRDVVSEAALRPFRKLGSFVQKNGNRRSAATETIWALRDVSFEIKRGEVVGIIGRNGAGKSTLLKILSRITEPTAGFAEIHGRVGSLLEVGTGFHPELTGRENIYLNGAILGMKRGEIQRKFDEMVAFAEVEKFIDTPVKHYSSGMYLRLAFAVAAHLEPEILLVDEVLAVGDAAFQKRCLGKMGEVAKEGRTVLFVSHDMTSVSVLCRSAILLDGGYLKTTGPPKSVVQRHLRDRSVGRSYTFWNPDRAPGDSVARILGVMVCDTQLTPRGPHSIMDPILLVLDFLVLIGGCRLNPVLIVKNSLGLTVFCASNYEEPIWASKVYAPGRYRTQCLVPGHLLNDGGYSLGAMVVQDTRFVRASVADAAEFEIYDEGATRGDYLGEWRGTIRPRCAWTTIDSRLETDDT